MDQPASQQQKLPAGLAGVLNPSEDQRDSAYFSTHDPSSKHTSTQSSNGGHIPSPPTPGYQSSILDKTPSPITTNLYTQPLNSPTSGSMSVASMVSPTTPASADAQSIHNRFSRPSYESGPMSAGLSMNGEVDSRRHSINSTLGNPFDAMRLNSSPYASNNQSTTSIQSTLQQQRNPGAHQDRNSGIRFSNSYQPNSQRQPDAILSPLSPKVMGGIPAKTAPTITGPALGNIARAPEPTKGQAWAFPEEEIQRNPSVARPSAETGSRHGTSYMDSRRSSMADSIASSQFTTESRLPPGQRRLEDGMPHDYAPRASGEFQTHHHSLQHKQVNDLQDGGAGSPSGTQPYSRTPELRVSHKLAERKRRTEMKDLFDTLRDLMPQERGSKASKWEILTKAISEHQRLQREVSQQRETIAMMSAETDTSRREANGLRLENTQLRSEVGRLNGYVPQGDQRVNGASSMENGYYAPGPRVKDAQGISKGTELPPIRGAFHSDDSMAGVQYSEAPAMHLGQHRPQSNPPINRGNGYQYQQPERVNGYPSQNDQPLNGFQQPRVNGFQQSEQPRPNSLNRPMEHPNF